MTVNRYDVLLTRGTSKVHTFTWAATRKGAATRIAREFEEHPDTWAGWEFEIY